MSKTDLKSVIESLKSHMLPDAADASPRNRAVGLLQSVSIAYVVLPAVLFLSGWLRPYYAIPLCIMAVAAAGMAMWRAHSSQCQHRGLTDSFVTIRGRAAHLAIPVVILVLLVCSPLGFSEYWRDFDYRKHIAFLNELTTNALPLAVPDWGYLVTSVGFYLPAAFLGRLSGSWDVACYAMLAWTFIGIYLSALWLIQLSGRLSFLQVLIFLCFGGLDILGAILFRAPYADTLRSVPGWYLADWSMTPASPLNGVFWL